MTEKTHLHHDVDQEKQNAKKMLIDLVVCIVIPSIILTKLSKDLGPTITISIALAIPIIYGAWDFATTKKHNPFAILGFLSHFLTALVMIFEWGALGIAIKEAVVPAAIGIFVFISQKMDKPLIRTLFYNPKMFDIEKIEDHLNERGNMKAFDGLMVKTNFLFALSFFVSSVLNFALAMIIIQSEPNTVEFAEEYGRMLALSYPVIVVPSIIVMFFALWYLTSGIFKLTGLKIDEITHAHQKGVHK